jgi:hypothetical protein
MKQDKNEMLYGLLTVSLINPPASLDEAYKEIKKALGLSDPQIDDDLGAVPNFTNVPIEKLKAPGTECFVVGVESKTLQHLVKHKHPNIVGCLHAICYAGGQPPLHLRNNSPADRGAGRKPAGPRP